MARINAHNIDNNNNFFSKAFPLFQIYDEKILFIRLFFLGYISVASPLCDYVAINSNCY